MSIFIQIRQMMAEQKLYEAHRLIENELANLKNNDNRPEYLLCLYELLKIERKKLSPILQLELVNYLMQKDIPQLLLGLEILNSLDDEKFVTPKARFEILINEKLGKIQIIYEKITQLMFSQIEKKRPHISEDIQKLKDKYFQNDFNLRLINLTISLLQFDLKKSEENIKVLVLDAVEEKKKVVKEKKINSIICALKLSECHYVLEIYQDLCRIYLNDKLVKTDIKKIIEMVIYFDEFKFKVLVLNILMKFGFESEGPLLAKSIKNSVDYSYLYVENNFPNLKKLFIKKQQNQKKFEKINALPLTNHGNEIKINFQEIDSVLDKESTRSLDFFYSDFDKEDEAINLLNLQDLTKSQMCDLAISLLQMEKPREALRVINMAIHSNEDDSFKIRAMYLKSIILFELKDFRKVIDNCLESLKLSKSKEDILAFLYFQSESYIQLSEYENAKKILLRVMEIDKNYRLARERLSSLNDN